MTALIPTISYDVLYSNLQETADWLESIGVSIKKRRRFTRVLKLTRLASEQYKSKSLEKLTQYAERHIVENALVQALEFREVFNTCHEAPLSESLLNKIREAMSGPLLDTDESSEDGSNRFRNTLFEFRVCNRLRKAGIDAHTAEDIDFVFNSSPYNIQCKRPVSASAVRNRLIEAREQIRTAKQNNKKTFGIVAISLDKISGIDGQFLTAPDEASVHTESSKIVERFVKENESFWDNICQNLVIWIFCFISYYAKIKTKNLLTAVFFMGAWEPAWIVKAENRHTRNIQKMGQQLKESDPLTMTMEQ